MKVLFVPVSGKDGIGEYMRSIILAKAIKDHRPDAEIYFILSEQAPYANACIYQTFLTKKSPTYHVKEVNQVIDNIKPDLVVFDASGRAKQIKYAKKSGAKTLFIAQHNKKIRKGMRLNRLLYTDYFWIAQPAFTVSELSWWSKCKIKLLKKRAPEFLGCVFVPPTAESDLAVLKKYNLEKNQYVFISAGSGGHYLANGMLAADGFHLAYSNSASSTKYIQVWGANYPGTMPDIHEEDGINLVSIDNSEFISLLKNSRYSLINGGDTLLQALSLRVPFVSVPVSSDQPERIKRAFNSTQAFLYADASVAGIIEQLNAIEKTEKLDQIANSLAHVEVKNGYYSIRNIL